MAAGDPHSLVECHGCLATQDAHDKLRMVVCHAQQREMLAEDGLHGGFVLHLALHVEAHVKNIFVKLEVNDRAHAVMVAVCRGMLDLSPYADRVFWPYPRFVQVPAGLILSVANCHERAEYPRASTVAGMPPDLPKQVQSTNLHPLSKLNASSSALATPAALTRRLVKSSKTASSVASR